MFLKIENKRNFFILIIILILAAGAVFFYFKQEKREKVGSPDDYVIIETEEGTIVENKKAGLTMKAPEGWSVRKINVMEGSVVFYSPDAQGLNPDKIRPPLQQGCMIETVVDYRKINTEDLKEEIKENHSFLAIQYDNFEEIEIKGKNILKNTFDCLELGPSIEIYILDDLLRGIGISTSSENLEKCSQSLNKFIDNLTIE